MSTAEAEPAPSVPQNLVQLLKMLDYFKCNRNRVDPEPVELPDCDFFNAGPRRTLRILRPELRSGHFYESQSRSPRPETLNDNFYLRWAKRPHPSGNCRCSFRQSSASNRLSSYEEKIISEEIQRIRTSLCEAEKSGQDIQELEKSLVVDLTKLRLSASDKDEPERSGSELKTEITADNKCAKPDKTRLVEEYVKRKIVKDLDRYISNLLDEILNDTIKAIAQTDNPFSKKRPAEKGTGKGPTAAFEVNFALDNGDGLDDIAGAGAKDRVRLDPDDGNNGYVNEGFIGSASDPDALDFHLRHRLNADVILENADCIDSGINSVETIELQPEQEQNLEQSLIDIIDAKLGGSSIGKSLEDLSMSIDGHPTNSPPIVKSASGLRGPTADTETRPNGLTTETSNSTMGEALVMGTETIEETGGATTADIRTGRQDSAGARISRPIDEAIEDAAFDGLRLEFRKDAADDPPSEKPSSNVTSKVNKTMLVIRQRIATRLANSLRKANDGGGGGGGGGSAGGSAGGRAGGRGDGRSSSSSNNNNSNNNNNNNNDNEDEDEDEEVRRQCKAKKANCNGGSVKLTTRSSLELEDYRRRFPVPESNRQQQHQQQQQQQQQQVPEVVCDEADEVTLRNRNRKPMIVFLHGFGSSSEAFEHQLRYFANLGYPCIAPDLLGHGLSSAPNHPRDYHFEKLLNDLEAVLMHYAFKPGRKCVLVAHNYGCSFATALACKYTSSVHQLVLISGGGPTPLAPPLTEGPGHCCLRASLAPLLFCGMQRAVLYSARGRQHPYCGSELLEDQWPSHMRHVQRGMSWPEGDYVFHRRICTPSLLVHGLRDDKVSLVQECQMERTMIKAFLEAIPTAGHMPMTDCPEQLNHMIHCFIDLWKNKKW